VKRGMATAPAFKTPYAEDRVEAPAQTAFRSRMECPPVFRRPRRREMETPGKHAHDHPRNPVEHHGLAQHRSPAGELFLPGAVAQNHCARRSRLILARVKVAPQNRRYTESPEEAVAHPRAGDS